MHLPKRTRHIHSEEEDESEKRNTSRKSDPFRDREIAVAVLSRGLTEGLEAFRMRYHLAAGGTGSKPAAEPRVLLNGRNSLIPYRFARCENPILAASFVEKYGCERVR